MRPGVLQMLFRGGSARAEADDDLRMGHREDVEPGTKQMLSEGGDVDPLDEDVGEDLIVAAEDIMDCMGDSYIGRAPGPDDSKIEKATKEASRRAKAKILAQALKAFVLMVE